MKVTQIRFFTSGDNTPKVPKPNSANPPKLVPLTGYISPTGKLVFPQKTIDQLGLAVESVRFQIGIQQGKRKLNVLYLVPTQDDQVEAFPLSKAAKSYTVTLGYILQRGGLDYRQTKYTFTLSPFSGADGLTGYALTIQDPTPKTKPAYTGKPRGRKPKSTN